MSHATNNQNSEKKKSTSSLEKALIASEIRYRRLFESAKDGILILDAQTGMIVDVNPFLMELLGYSKESFIEKTIWGIGFFKDIIDNKDKFRELQRNKYVRYEDLPLETADGRKINVEFVSNVYLVNSNKVIQCNIRDITERKKTESGLEKTRKELADIKTIADEAGMFTENVIDTVRDPLLVLDEKLRVIKASRSFYTIFKVKPEDTIGRLIYDLGNQQWDIPKLRELLEKILPEKATFDNYEVEHNFPSIGTRIMLLNARQIKRGSGKEKIILLAFEDVTERRREERSLSEKSRLTNEYLNILLDHAHAPIIIWDSSLLIKRFNPEFERLSGYNKSEVQDKKIEMLFPKNEVASTLELIKNNIGNENPEVIEINILTKDKKIRTVLWNSANISDEEGKNTVATIAQDITSRKQSEKELNNSEIRYRRLFESAKDGILILDGETGMIVDVNPFLINLLGYPKENFTKKAVWEIGFFNDIVQNKDKFLELQQKEYVRYKDLPLETADGRKIHIEFVSNVYLVDKKKVIQCNIRDITERKLAEDAFLENEIKYRVFFDNSMDAILLTSSDGKIQSANQAACSMFGYSEVELIKLGRSGIVDATDPRLSVMLTERKLKGKTLGELTFNRKDGTHFLAEISSAVFKDNEGNDRTSMVIRDITGRKKLETNLSTAAEIAKLGYWEFDVKSGNFIFNDQYYRLIHGSSTEKQGGNIMSAEEFARKLVHPDDSKIIGTNLQEAISSIDPEYFGQAEARVFRDNGDIANLIIQFKVLKDQFGNIHTVYGISQDITERKLAEEKIISLAKFPSENPDPVLRISRDGRLLFANEASYSFFTWKLELEKPAPAVLQNIVNDVFKLKKFRRIEIENNKRILSVHAVPLLEFNYTNLYIRDITENKLVEEKIYKSEYRYRNLFENIGIAIWEEDFSDVRNYIDKLKKTGINDFRLYFDKRADEVIKCASLVKILDVNMEVLNVVKAKSKKEVIKSLPAFFIEGSFNAFKEELIALAEGKMKIDGEIPIKILNGEIRQIFFQLTIVPGYEDTWARGLFSFIDITEKKKTEQALRESEKHLHEILENIDAVFYMMSGKTGELVYVNSAYEKLWERPIAVVKENPESWIDAVHPEDVNSAIKFYEKGSGELQYRIILPDGTIRWILDRMFPVLDEKGEVIYLCGMAADITERKLYEETLRESEAKLDEAMKIAKLGMWEYDVDRNQFKFNDQFYTLLHTTAEREGGYIMSPMHYAQKFVHPDDMALVGEETKKALDTNDPNYNTRLDHRIIYADGELGYINVNIRVMKDSHGHTVKTYGVNQDITERKRTEESLRLFRTLLDKSNDAIEVIDMETGHFIDANERACTDLGYSRSELLNMKIYDIDPIQTPEIFQSLKDGFKLSNSTIIETLHKRKDGATFPVEVNVTVVNLERIYIIAIVRDITERKRDKQELIKAKEKAEATEIQLLSILENSPTGFAINTISTGKVRYFNKAFSNIYHIPHEFCQNVESFFEYVYGDQTELGNKILDDVKSSDPERMKWNLIPITDKTTKKVHFVSAANIILKDLDLMISSVWDITSQVENEEKLVAALHKATESDRLKSAFLANMSHEIRTPMNGILGFAGLLKEPGLSGEKQQEYIKIIEKSGARMLNIISEIMDISRIESGQMEVIYRETNINKLIESTFNLIKLDADYKRINLSFKNSLPAKETIIKTDSEKLYSILTNLVKNAVKYTDKGTVEFGFKNLGNYLEFYVKDTGIGIPSEKQEVIFERFIQADIADIQARQGAGLGLSIAKAFVELLRGKIWVESEQGKGSIFYFTLPFDHEPEEPNSVRQVVPPEGAMNKIDNLKILIAEDDETSEMLMSITISEFGKEIIKAKTGSEAVEICRSNPDIDLILMDIRMPDLNGYEATRQIRQFNKDVIIIAQTAFGLVGDREKAIKAGCNDYISKPITKNKLLTLIQKYFKK